jgi:hypothetical protein
MRSWRPRDPSAPHKARLFGRAATDAQRERAAVGAASWLAWLVAPRHACTALSALALIGLAMAGGGWSKGVGPSPSFPALAAISNQSWMVCLGLVQVRHNTPSPILGWTSGDRFPSTTRSLDRLHTNHLLPKL